MKVYILMVLPQLLFTANHWKNTRPVFVVSLCFLDFTLLKENLEIRTTTKEHRCNMLLWDFLKIDQNPAYTLRKLPLLF